MPKFIINKLLSLVAADLYIEYRSPRIATFTDYYLFTVFHLFTAWISFFHISSASSANLFTILVSQPIKIFADEVTRFFCQIGISWNIIIYRETSLTESSDSCW